MSNPVQEQRGKKRGDRTFQGGVFYGTTGMMALHRSEAALERMRSLGWKANMPLRYHDSPLYPSNMDSGGVGSGFRIARTKK